MYASLYAHVYGMYVFMYVSIHVCIYSHATPAAFLAQFVRERRPSMPKRTCLLEELSTGASAEEMPRRRMERSSTTLMASCIGGAPAVYAGDWNEASATFALHRICGSVDQGRFATTAFWTAWMPQTLRNFRSQCLLLVGQALHRMFHLLVSLAEIDLCILVRLHL